MKNSKFIREVTVTDPDTKSDVEVLIYKHQNGGIFGVDKSYVQYLDNIIFEEDEVLTVPDVFNVNQSVTLEE